MSPSHSPEEKGALSPAFIFTASKPRREVKITPIQDFFNYVLLKVIPSLGISFMESFLNAGC